MKNPVVKKQRKPLREFENKKPLSRENGVNGENLDVIQECLSEAFCTTLDNISTFSTR